MRAFAPSAIGRFGWPQALTHAVRVDELKEELLQTSVYCGVPAANTSFHAASELPES